MADEERYIQKRSNFKKMYPLDFKITLLVNHNPKLRGTKSWTRFEGYYGAKTVSDALAGGVTYQDIAYDVGRQFIKVG